MTISDLRCDACGSVLLGPGADDADSGPFGIRFLYHPGNPLMKDDSGLLCQACWREIRGRLAQDRPRNRCSMCNVEVPSTESLHVHRAGDPIAWQLCRTHAVEFLNGLRTVEPKLDEASFAFPVARRGSSPGPPE